MIKLKKLALIMISLLVVASSMVFSVSAASTTIGLSKKSINVGDSVTVTVTVKGNEEMYATEGYVDYDANVLKFVSGNSAAPDAAGTVKIVGTPGGSKSQSYSLKFTAIATGSAGVKFRDVVYVGNEEVKVNGSSVNVSVTDKSQSTNANLSSLRLSSGSLSPSFKSGTTSYSAKVANSVTSVSVYATAADSNAKVSIEGNKNLKVGENTCTVTVTAPSGATKAYTIKISRGEDGEEEPENNDETVDEIGPLDVTIGIENYTVNEVLGENQIPTGFKEDKSVYSEKEVVTLKSDDGEYVLYLLTNKATGTTDYFTHDEVTGTFSLLPYLKANEKVYIFADDEVKGDIEGYHESYINLGNTSVDAYSSDSAVLSDFYIIYCYVDGKYGYYRYDSAENTIQRAPDFLELALNATQEENKEVMSSLKDFSKISNYGKVVIIIIALIILCVILLIVMVIVRYINMRRNERMEDIDFENEISLFDEISVEDNSEK